MYSDRHFSENNLIVYLRENENVIREWSLCYIIALDLFHKTREYFL